MLDGMRIGADGIDRGKTIEQARELDREQLVKAVGGLPAASMHASHLAMDALGAALSNLRARASLALIAF